MITIIHLFRGLWSLVLALTAGVAVAGLPGQMRVESIVVLRAEILDVRADRTTPLGTMTVEIRPDQGGSAAVDLHWPAGVASARLTLQARGRTGETAHPLNLEATLLLEGGRQIGVERALEMTEGSTYLLDVYETDERARLVLALSAESDERPVFSRERVVGDPVRFLLEIVRVNGEQTVPLETNRLVTFVGESVQYSFRRGQDETAESIELTLRPVKLDGDLARVELEVTASLPGQRDRLLLSRRESLYTTRHATSALDVVAGEPPLGYRFRVTTDF